MIKSSPGNPAAQVLSEQKPNKARHALCNQLKIFGYLDSNPGPLETSVLGKTIRSKKFPWSVGETLFGAHYARWFSLPITTQIFYKIVVNR